MSSDLTTLHVRLFRLIYVSLTVSLVSGQSEWSVVSLTVSLVSLSGQSECPVVSLTVSLASGQSEWSV